MSTGGDLAVLLRLRDFRRLYATRLTSQVADGAFQVGLASVFFFSPERQTSAGRIAAAFAVLLLPYSLVGPFAGVLLDRWRRRQILVWSNALRAVMVLGVAALVAAEVVGPTLYAAILACVSVNRFFLAGLSAALPHVVDRPALVLANSVSTTSGTLAALAGAGAAFLVRPLL
ncbi:MAG: MFS transporter, partial [Actinomycetota bacterium]|nr:MFS transporter [Actinomycetota bacterium]